MARARPAGRGYFWGTEGASSIQGHTAIVFTLPSLFLTTVIFMSLSWGTVEKGEFRRSGRYFFSGTEGASSIQGHTAIVCTLPLVFLMMVIFMVQTLPE